MVCVHFEKNYLRQKYPDLKITIRADSGFSCPAFLDLAHQENLFYVMGIAANAVLKQKTQRVENVIRLLYLKKKQKHQHFFKFDYMAKSWTHSQDCIAKVESTGKGMNIRFIISNIEGLTPREVYHDIYVKRGDTSENRIKEVKNMCFSDRLSMHKFWPNFFRLFLSSLAYEFILKIKEAIQQTIAHRWQVSTIRVSLLKIGAAVKVSKKRVYYQFSRAFVHQKLFIQLMKTI